jgi:hypothetical protein
MPSSTTQTTTVVEVVAMQQQRFKLNLLDARPDDAKRDAKWFHRHSHRTIRLRDTAPGELAELEVKESEIRGYPCRIAVI